MSTVGTAWVEIVPSARGFGRRLQSEIGGDVSTAGRVGGGAYGEQFGDEAGRRSKSRFAGVFSALKGAGVLAAAAAGAAVGKVLVDSIEAASDFSETQAKASQIFGADQLPALQEFADGAAESLGQSKQAALDSATTFGVFGKSAGKTGGDLVDFSTQMTTLASDLASFGNTTPEEATEALGAALRGEAEPIRKYGVLLDDATLRQRALKDGLIETTSQALTPQQRVLAAQSEILAQTGDAQGDFARTSDGLANQQRILTAQWENAKVAIGTVLLPIVTRFFRYVNSTAIPAIKGFVEGFKNLRRSGGDAEGFVGVALGALRKLVGYFRGNFGMVKTIVRDALELVKVIWERYGDIIIRTVRGLFNSVKDVVRGGMRIIRGIIKVITGLLEGDWKKAWSGLKDIVRGVFQSVRGMIRGAMSLFKGLLQAGWRTMKTITSSAWNGLKGVVKDGVDDIVAGIRALPGRIRALGGLLKAAGGAIMDQLVDGMKNAAGVVSGIAGNVWDAVRGMLNSALSQIDAALSFTIKLPGPDISVNAPIPRLATGTNFHRGGLALVGEEGPELVSMPRGTKVTPHGESMRMLAGRGPVPLGGSGGRTTLIVNGPVPLRVGEYEMQAWFERAFDAEMALD